MMECRKLRTRKRLREVPRLVLMLKHWKEKRINKKMDNDTKSDEYITQEKREEIGGMREKKKEG